MDASNPFYVFDEPNALAINKARMETISQILDSIKGQAELSTALDLGAGVGYFSAFLRDLGFQVVGVEGRASNVEEARRRYPDISFLHIDVESSQLTSLPQADLVLFVGLLYHLKNPLGAIENLARVVGKVVIVESMIYQSADPSMVLIREPKVGNQGLDYIAFYPSESCIVDMLYYVGMPYVYRVTVLPKHPDFMDGLLSKRVRTMIVASRLPLRSPLLALTSASPPGYQNIYRSAQRIKHPMLAKFLMKLYQFYLRIRALLHK